MALVQFLDTTFVERVWGSHALEPFFANPSTKKIGEVWLTREPPLPLLFKFIFTTEPLSVQVHPGGAAGKTEMWHILRAEPGATVALGFTQSISPAQAREASLSGEIEHLLNWMPVTAGDTIFVPAGTVHAIGAGVTICEVQQNSDVTYRLYDYGRRRELHLEKGLAVAILDPHPGLTQQIGERLVECEYFIVDRVEIRGERRLRDCTVIALDGEAIAGGQPIRRGMACYVEGETIVAGQLEAIVARVP